MPPAQHCISIIRDANTVAAVASCARMHTPTYMETDWHKIKIITHNVEYINIILI